MKCSTALLGRLAIAGAMFVAAAAIAAAAGPGPGTFDLTWHRIAGGGETFSTGGNFSLGGTIGQHEAGEMSGGPGGEFTLTGGFWAGAGAAGGDPTPPCPGDLTGSGSVGVPDLLILLAAWGPCADPAPGMCPADLTGSGAVGVPDLLIVLGAWGPCP